MRRTGLLLGLVLICSGLLAQSGVSVIYARTNRIFPVTFNGEKRELPDQHYRLVFDDSLSYFYFFGEGKDPLRKATSFGHKLVHHATYYRKGDPVVYFGNNYTRSKGRELIVDTLIRPGYQLVEGTRSILGYTCYGALQVIQNNDSTLVWFTPEIPMPYGPMAYVGFPGLVLEIQDQRYGGSRLVATSIQEGNYRMGFPYGEKISTRFFKKGVGK